MKSALLSILAVSAMALTAQAKSTVAACEDLVVPQFQPDDSVVWTQLPKSGIYIYDDKTSVVKVNDQQEVRKVEIATDVDALDPEGMSELLGLLGYSVSQADIQSIAVWRLISSTNSTSFGESMSYAEVKTKDAKIIPVVQLGYLIGKCTKK